ncbi:hypothetical protein IV102_37375 [bacterium]|nr:hypothetical protein [bacterium]
MNKSTEASRLDGRLDELSERTDRGFARVGHEMQTMRAKIQEQLQAMILAINDQVGAVVKSIEQVKADHKETTRTLQGRSRLMEDRFGKMLDLVETSVGDAPTRIDYEALAERLEALEKRIDSAA